MDTAQLTELELQVDFLLRTVEELKAENKSLRQRVASAVQDRSELQERHAQATGAIKTIIGQLKEELE